MSATDKAIEDAKIAAEEAEPASEDTGPDWFMNYLNWWLTDFLTWFWLLIGWWAALFGSWQWGNDMVL
jgi:hypothetical protein